ncbi:PepSY domain-containing protein [Geodermatophilus sp. URMC 65]
MNRSSTTPMYRPPAPRRFLRLVLVVLVGVGIALGAAAIWSATSDAETLQAARAQTAGTSLDPSARPSADSLPETTGTPSSAPAPTSTPLTLEDAKAVATEVAPGRVVEWDQDNERTGLRYDVTVLHDDGSTTEVEVDAATGQVTSINRDTYWD